MSLATRVLAGILLAAAVFVAAVGFEPILFGERKWPYGPISLQGGAFTVKAGRTLDLEEAADAARLALPDYVALVTDWSDEPMLVLGRDDGRARETDLRKWRDASGLPLEGPDPIGMGCSAPDWFSAPRRTHDVVFAGCAALIAAAAVAMFRPKRRASLSAG